MNDKLMRSALFVNLLTAILASAVEGDKRRVIVRITNAGGGYNSYSQVRQVNIGDIQVDVFQNEIPDIPLVHPF